MAVAINSQTVLPSHGTVAGFWLYAQRHAQAALMGHPPRRAVAAMDAGHTLTITSPVDAAGAAEIDARLVEGDSATVTLRAGTQQASLVLQGTAPQTVRLNLAKADRLVVEVAVPQEKGPAAVELVRPRLRTAAGSRELSWLPNERPYPQVDAVTSSPAPRPAIEQAMIEWDWRMQDGIGTPRESQTYAQAIDATLTRGQQLLADLASDATPMAEHAATWKKLAERRQALAAQANVADRDWEGLWLDVHRARRALVLANPRADLGSVLFAKHVPSTMSHQLTQYYGYAARPGGGLFLLKQPGKSMETVELGTGLPGGNYLHPWLSYDAKRVYFAWCDCPTGPKAWRDPTCFDRRYHLYRIDLAGGAAQRLTDGPYDDFSPTELPSGKLLFVSTRRGGFHRCGGGPCYVYSLALAEADGSNPHAVSFHETNEWDPTILHDGRVVYTRWDYVDRNAVFYQQLWSVRQDGSHVQIYYGNNTYNPVGTWEARPIPGSNKIMATAAPHHGMTAGSVILLDVTRGVDGTDPITRLTPDALFPEAETGLAHGITVDKPTRFDDEPTKTWGPQPQSQATRLAQTPAEEKRWPGHCYRSPWPLSEKYFLAAYSFDRLRGEPGVNRPNQFGLYLCDAFGNKELLYRDPNLSSVWPTVVAPRAKPPVLEMPSHWAESTPQQPEGTFFLQNIYESWPKLPDVAIARLRVVQVLPKTTPNANNPRVGAANASPGKQVLGTVPVESDGSAYFRVPARTPVLFQALDAQGRAVQTMRSLTYLQPGEHVSCVGCHERRDHAAPESAGKGLAMRRAPSSIEPGPDGSRPLSYPLLVQPVLDRQCVACHNPGKPEGKVVLTGEPAGAFSRSYNALIGLVSYTAWGNPQNNFEPLTAPDRFGTRASRLTSLIERGHYGVQLSADEWERLTTWMDTNGLFYGTFNPADQAQQLRGARIAGPDLE